MWGNCGLSGLHRWVLVTLLMAPCAVCAQSVRSVDPALVAASQWIHAIDHDDARGSFMTAASLLRERTTLARWRNYLLDCRAQRGRVTAREWVRVDRVINPVGFPAGEYLTVYYLVNAEKGLGLADQVSLRRSDDRWVPVGYVVIR